MPHIPFPKSRTLQEKRDETIAGRECEIYIYDELFTARLFDPMDWLIRLLHGKEWHARHIRVEVPHEYDDYIRKVHDARGRHWPTDLPSVEEHVQDVRQKARDAIESGKADDRTCH